MDKCLIEKSTLYAIADSIRGKNETTDMINPLNMPEAIDNIETAIKITNGVTSMYMSNDVDIDAGNFVEFIEKIGDGTYVYGKSNAIAANQTYTPNSSLYEYIMGIYPQDYIRIDDNNYLVAIVQQVYRSNSEEYIDVVYFKKVVLEDGVVTATYNSGNVTLDGYSSGVLREHNGIFYYISIAKGNTTYEISRNLSINCTKITVAATSVTINSTTNHACGTCTCSNASIVCSAITSASHIIVSMSAFGSSSGYSGNWLLIFDVTSTSTTNYYLKSYGTDYESLQKVTTVFDDDSLYVTGVFASGSVQNGLYTYSSSGLTLKSSEVFNGDGGQLGLTIYSYYDRYTTTLKIYENDCLNVKNTFVLPITNSNLNMYGMYITDDDILVGYGSEYVSSETLYYHYIYSFKLDFEMNTAELLDIYDGIPGGLQNIKLSGPSVFDMSNCILYPIVVNLNTVKCVQLASNKIDGLTKTLCTPDTAGEVWCLA